MSENMNTTNPQGDDLLALKKMFGDFKKKQTQASKRTSRGDILAKYFTPRNDRELFRVLPPLEGRKLIEEAFFHVLTTNASGGKKKHGTVIYCPAHNDPKVPKLDEMGNQVIENGKPVYVPAPCPSCEKYLELLKTQDNSLFGIKKEDMNDSQRAIKDKNDAIYKEAIKWEAKKYYIIKGIDKGAIKDGPKFWRFKHNYKNQGTLNKLLPIMEQFVTKNQVPFYDPIHGADFEIMTTDSEFNGFIYKSIIGVTTDKCPIHTDQILVDNWLSDDMIWRDVYKPRKAPGITPYQYLQFVVEGTDPYWDESNQNDKKWIFPGRPELQTKANTRTINLDATHEREIEQASDLQPVQNQTTGQTMVSPPATPSVTPPMAPPVTPPVTPSVETIPTESSNNVINQNNVVQTLDEDVDDSDINNEPDDGDYDDLPF